MSVNYLYACNKVITILPHLSSYEVDIKSNQIDAFPSTIDLSPVLSCVLNGHHNTQCRLQSTAKKHCECLFPLSKRYTGSFYSQLYLPSWLA